MISEYYTAKGSRSFYKGTSFRCTKWDINTHYFNNEDFIDFVSYNGCLLKCNRSHISSTENEPLLTIRDGIIVGIENSSLWEFVMGGVAAITGTNREFKIMNGHLYISYNNGGTWEDLGNVTGAKGDPGDIGPKGEQGDKGDKGDKGDPGKGIPEGGYTGQVLVKNSNSDYDTIWKTIETGEGGSIPEFSATVANVETASVSDASVVLTPSNQFKFSFKLQKGADGKGGVDGTNGIYTEYRFAKNSSRTEAPTINASNTENPGSNWTAQWPVINSGEYLWMTFIKRNSKDNSAVVGEVWATPVCITGEQGPQGPIGSTGVSGIPGVGIVMRFCNGTDDAPSSSKPSNILNTASQGWYEYTPSTTTEYPRIWFIQGRLKYTNNDDSEGYLDGSWSDPALFNGPAGTKGDAGSKGQLIYPAGVYDVNTTYTTTEESAPYVYVYNADTSKSGYYLLSAVTSWTGTDHNSWSPVESIDNEEAYWTKFNHFEAIFADVAIFPNSLIGSAVFNGDYMFSQTGKDTTGINTNYQNFTPENLSYWTPAYWVNLKTGEMSLNFGQCTFNYVESSYSLDTIITLRGAINNLPSVQYVVNENNFIRKPNVYIDVPSDEPYNLDHIGLVLDKSYLPNNHEDPIMGSVTNSMWKYDPSPIKLVSVNDMNNLWPIRFYLSAFNSNTSRFYKTTVSKIYLTPGATLHYKYQPKWYDDEYSQTADFHVEGDDGSELYVGIYGDIFVENVSDFVYVHPTQQTGSIIYGGITVTYPDSCLISKYIEDLT